jgi:WD40 repeat protein
MARVACLLLASLSLAQPARADDLPPGAVARLGDNRFRAGGDIEHIAISPDGKQFATATWISKGRLMLAVWDGATGQTIREYEVNRQLFKGFVWGSEGAFAVVVRAEPGTKDKPGKVFPDDFRVWDFTRAAPPLLPQVTVGLGTPSWWVDADWPNTGPKYSDFQISADGSRLAALWSGDKHAVHVFELKTADTAAQLKRVGTLDLGAEGAEEVRISADGKSVVTFRTLANDGEMTATRWDVATGKPAKSVRVAWGTRLMVTPDSLGLVVFNQGVSEWGFDQYDLTTGEKRQLTRWKYDPNDPAQPIDWGGFAFTPSGRELVVVVAGKDRRTYVIDLATGKERGGLEGHAQVVADGLGIVTAVSADGARIATADASGLVRLWDAKTLRAINDAPGHRAPVEHAQLSPDGKRLLTWADDGTIRLWDLATGKELRAFISTPGSSAPDNPAHGRRPTFTPDGTTVVYSTEKGLIARDLQTGLEVPLPGGMAKLEPRFAVFAPDGKSVLTWATGTRPYVCEVWSWPGGQKVASWDSSADDFAPGFSPVGSVIFTHAASPERRDAKTGKELPPAWQDDRDIVTLVSLRPNPQLVINNTEDGAVLLEAGTGKQVPGFCLTPSEGNRRVPGIDLALSPTGREFADLAFPLGDAALVCEIATGEVRRRLTGHRGRVRVLGFTPDGTKLLTAGGDHTVLVWDVRLQSVPLPEAVKKETSAAKLWDTLAAGNAKDAYLAMARLARDPEAAVKMAAMKLKPATKADPGTDAGRIADARAVELLEAIGTDAARALLKELAGGHAGAFRTQEAKRALERNAR